MTTASSLSLTKGQKLSLTKEHPGFTNILVGLGWNPRRTTGKKFDLDASAFLTGPDGKIRDVHDFVFYNPAYLAHASGAVIHNGDNQDGEGEGDDETLSIDLTKVPADIQAIVIAVSIYAGRQRQQNFGMVDGAFVRLVDPANGNEVRRFDLSEEASTVTSMIFVRFYRKDNGWSLAAVAQGYDGGLKRLCAEHGLEVEEEVDEG
ncbi:MAG: TerD family protein [Candidatus Melainabacteria bacterium]|jgi:tellurium resistance protein TerD|nr:TerD family protein [Candidatus Melainabacteria bacterium]